MVQVTHPAETLLSHVEGFAWYGGAVVALLATFRWLLTLVGGRQDKRIAKLEAAHEEDNAKMIALAHALIELMAVLERHPTSDVDLIRARLEAVHRARLALVAVFKLPEVMPKAGTAEVLK